MMEGIINQLRAIHEGGWALLVPFYGVIAAFLILVLLLIRLSRTRALARRAERAATDAEGHLGSFEDDLEARLDAARSEVQDRLTVALDARFEAAERELKENQFQRSGEIDEGLQRNFSDLEQHLRDSVQELHEQHSEEFGRQIRELDRQRDGVLDERLGEMSEERGREIAKSITESEQRNAEALQERLAALTAEIEQRTEALAAELEQRIAAAAADVDGRFGEMSEERGREIAGGITESEQRNAEALQERLAALTAEIEKRIAGIAAESEQRTEALAAKLEGRMEEKAGKLEARRTQLMDQTLGEIERRQAEGLQQHGREREALLAGLGEKVAGLGARLDALASEMEGLHRKLSDLEGAVPAISKRIDAIRASAAQSRRSEIEELLGSFDTAASAVLGQIQKEIEAGLSRVGSIQQLIGRWEEGRRGVPQAGAGPEGAAEKEERSAAPIENPPPLYEDLEPFDFESGGGS